MMVFSLKLLNWMCQHAESVGIFLISGFDEMHLEWFTFVSSTTLCLFSGIRQEESCMSCAMRVRI